MPTNIVTQRGGTSARELDWVLVGASTPVRSCTKSLLPGLSTHRAVVCRLMLAPGFLVAQDAKRGRLRFRGAGDSELEVASAVAALVVVRR